MERELGGVQRTKLLVTTHVGKISFFNQKILQTKPAPHFSKNRF